MPDELMLVQTVKEVCELVVKATSPLGKADRMKRKAAYDALEIKIEEALRVGKTNLILSNNLEIMKKANRDAKDPNLDEYERSFAEAQLCILRKKLLNYLEGAL